jgi:hypothetical protein
MTTTTAEPVTLRIRGPLLVLATYALTTLLSILLHVGEILFTNHDAHASDGPVASIVDAAVVGTPALVIALAISIPLHRDAARARVGAIVLGVLMILSLPVFWSGASAVFGAAAAWLGGLTRAAHPQAGAARAFGIAGLVMVVLQVLLTLVGGAAAALLA